MDFLKNLFWGWLFILFTLIPCKGVLDKFAEDVTLSLVIVEKDQSIAQELDCLESDWSYRNKNLLVQSALSD